VTAGLLVTADGRSFRGRSVGAPGIAVGEAVFNTSMTGYQEVFTDPSYSGQVVVMTAPHVGNHGVTADDDQAASFHCAGVVMRALARRHSNWRAEDGLGARLGDRGVVALDGVDTRALTRHLRVRGAMQVALGSGVTEAELAEAARSAPPMAGSDLATSVSTPTPYEVPAGGEERFRVVAYDFGVKRDILRRLSARGIRVTVVPAGTPAGEVLARRPDGVVLSNGPGDPEPLAGPVAAVGALLGRVPLFGICLGHQVLGLALGASTFKLPFGHHGGNHPVRRLDTGTVEITSQNHGFAMDPSSLADDRSRPGRLRTTAGEAEVTHVNLNDGTLEGLRCLEVPAFSVQYHPEAAPGPRDADPLFDVFVSMMERPA
jgi:carbamoyl-phosphate synthase small subunit